MSSLRVDDHGAVRLLTWDRPAARNALDDDLWDATGTALRAAADDDTVHCVVLTGAGGAFSAGQDLNEMATPRRHDDGKAHGYAGFMPSVESFDKPLVAAVDGVAVGVGVTVLPYCDLVLVSDRARFRTPFVPLGVTTEAGSSVTLAERIGWQRAAELLFTADWLDAAGAVEAGLALRVVDADALLDEALALAARIAAHPLDPLRTTKRLLLAGRQDRWRAAREREDIEFARMVAI